MSIADKLQAIAENEQRVYEAGYEKGKAEGGDTTEAYNQGVEAGKIAQKEDFWDKFTTALNSKGEPYTKTNYQYSFAYWNEDLFYPTKNLTANSMNGTFQGFNENGTPIDLKQRLIDCGVTLDTRNSSVFQGTFHSAYVSTIPTLDTQKCTNLNGVFAYSKVETIEKIILKSDGTQNFTSTFSQCTDLKEIRFEGVIAKSISFAQSPLLSADSVADIIAHLGTITTAQTITFHEDVKAKLTDEQKATITQTKGWTLA